MNATAEKKKTGCAQGYRWLEAGEVLRAGDEYMNGNRWHRYEPMTYGEQVAAEKWSVGYYRRRA